MEIEVVIDEDHKEPKIIILTDKITDKITHIMKRLSEEESTLKAYTERGVEIVEFSEIIRIYAENKKVFVQTSKGNYTVRSRLYELEEKMDNQVFVRISNSEIVNRKKIIHMDISMTGTIGVTLKGDIKTYASRRYVSKIKRLLGI